MNLCDLCKMYIDSKRRNKKKTLLNSRDWPYKCCTITGFWATMPKSFALWLRDDRHVRCHRNYNKICSILYVGKARIKPSQLTSAKSTSTALNWMKQNLNLFVKRFTN